MNEGAVSAPLDRLIAGMPKAELHIHLEGLSNRLRLSS